MEHILYGVLKPVASVLLFLQLCSVMATVWQANRLRTPDIRMRVPTANKILCQVCKSWAAVQTKLLSAAFWFQTKANRVLSCVRARHLFIAAHDVTSVRGVWSTSWNPTHTLLSFISCYTPNTRQSRGTKLRNYNASRPDCLPTDSMLLGLAIWILVLRFTWVRTAYWIYNRQL